MPPVASLPTYSNRSPRSSVSRGEATQWSVHEQPTSSPGQSSAPRCGCQICTRDVPGTKRGISGRRHRAPGGCWRRACSRSGRRSRSRSASCRRRAWDTKYSNPPLTSCVPAARRQQLRDAAGQLSVVALFRIGRVEIRRVVLQAGRDARRAARQERRIEDAVAVPPAFSASRTSASTAPSANVRAPSTPRQLARRAGSASTASSIVRGIDAAAEAPAARDRCGCR